MKTLVALVVAFSCVGSYAEDACISISCEPGLTCVNSPKQCFTTPCPQYECVRLRPTCGRHEKLYECGACDTTCATVRAGDATMCTADCRSPECGCKRGYARHENGKCVRESACKNTNSRVRRSARLCKLRSKPGPCKAYFPSFYYDHQSKTCKSFVYGGCKGNANRFPTEEACMAKCGSQEVVCPEPTTPEPAPEYCGYSLLEDSNGCKSYQMWCA